MAKQSEHSSVMRCYDQQLMDVNKYLWLYLALFVFSFQLGQKVNII